MPATERAFDRGTRTGDRALRTVADELREARLGLGVSQEHVAAAARVSRPRYSKIERAKAPTLTIAEAGRLASVLGLDLWLRLYPGPEPLRDEASSRLLRSLLAHARAPLGQRKRTAIELEMRLRDGQAVEPRIALKRRDDPTEAFLLAIAGTRANRRLLRANPGLFADLPRLRASDVLAALEAGRHPPTGLVLV